MEKIQQPDSPTSKANNAKNNASPTKNSNSSYGRHCHIVKRADFDGYGFNLHSEKIKPGQYIGKVDPGSPAEAAGLREGDQIIEVNGVNIGSETHKQVVQRIKAISNEVRLLLIDPTVECVATNSKSQTTTTTVSSSSGEKTNNKTSNNNESNSTSPTTSIVPMTIVATTTSEHQKDEDSSISMVSMKSQSGYSNDPTMDVVDFTTNKETINNSHHAATTIIIANGKSSESLPVREPPTISLLTPSEQQSLKSQNTDTQSQNKSGLNLNLTAAEMRAKLLAKKKFDPKNESVDLKKKFDIIQKL